jgi:hypothetical protein
MHLQFLKFYLYLSFLFEFAVRMRWPRRRSPLVCGPSPFASAGQRLCLCPPVTGALHTRGAATGAGPPLLMALSQALCCCSCGGVNEGGAKEEETMEMVRA